jgi:dTDP-4-dehydrorhamnose reductase
MKILLIGALGQLGTDLKKVLTAHEVIPVDKEEIDICSAAQVDAIADALRPEILLNCAAFNRVDEAEDAPEAAFAVNTFAVRNLALAARRLGAALVHFTSDYVFDGPQRTPYVETDLPCPRSMYGISKLAGEAMTQALAPKHFLIRTCGLYGYTGSRDKGTNFVEAMLSLAAKGGPVRVVSDQVCTPTSTMDLANAVARLIITEKYGLYHLTSGGGCSWHEFALAVFEEAGLHPEVVPVTSDHFPAKAKRPWYSVLDNRRFRDEGFGDLRHWREALRAYIRGRAAGKTRSASTEPQR